MKGIKPKINKIDKLGLKPNRKLGLNGRTIDTHCPYCLSRLVLDDNNKYKCSAEKIFIWVDDFKLFANLEDEEQEEYLNDLDDPEKFLDLFEKWEFNELDCIYNNKFFNVLNVVNTILDPLTVNKIENSLKRPLSEEEKSGESPIWTDGVNYFDEYDKGLILFKIPTIVFPEDV